MGTHQTDCTAQQQPSPATIGKELEHQLLFGEHRDRSTSSSAAATATAPGAGAPSRIQAGFLLVKLDDSNNCDCSSLSPLNQGNTTAPAGGNILLGGNTVDSSTVVALEGAAIAQQATGAPLMLACSHFIQWSTVEAAVAVATAHLADADVVATPTGKKVIVAGMHGGVSQSLQGQTALLNKGGVVLCFDCFGRVEWLPGSDYYPSDEEIAVRIAELVRQGFADRIVVSSGVSRRIHLSRCAVQQHLRPRAMATILVFYVW